MNKTVVYSICGLLLVGLIFTIVNMKNAYKVLPISTQEPKVAAYADWREFIPQSKKFKVMLPAVPQYAHEAVLIPNTNKKRHYEMYVSEKLDGAIFMISQITYPADYDTTNANGLLQAIVDEMVKTNPDNHLNSVIESKFKGQPAVDFNITNKDFGVDGKAFMFNKTVYLITYVAKNAEFNAEEYKHFIDSFELDPKSIP